jgi:hypothetical protein
MFDLPEAKWEFVRDETEPGFGWYALPKSMQSRSRGGVNDLMEFFDDTPTAMARALERINNMSEAERKEMDEAAGEGERGDAVPRMDEQCIIA